MTGKHVFWYFVIFFGIIIVVNAIMMTLAIRTHSGVVTDHAYEKGLAYNKVVEAEQKQQELQWNAEINYKNGILYFILKDDTGIDITPDKSTASFTRPTETGMDFTQELTRSGVAVPFPAKGVWDVRVDAIVGEQKFQQSKRMVIK